MPIIAPRVITGKKQIAKTPIVSIAGSALKSLYLDIIKYLVIC